AGPKRSQVVGLFLAVFAWSGCVEETPRTDASLPKAEELRVEGLDLSRWGRRGETAGPEAPELSAHASRATLDRSTQRIRAEEVVIDAYSPTRAHLGRMLADTATTDLDGERLVATGHVRITDEVGRTIETTRVIYTPANARVVAPDPVRLSGGNFEIQAPRAELDLSAQTIEVPGLVQGKVWPEKR
ncbi:MAG: LPS export ABC transporter periplasmic protein LptC, partial [Myxococcota bacterium]